MTTYNWPQTPERAKARLRAQLKYAARREVCPHCGHTFSAIAIHRHIGSKACDENRRAAMAGQQEL